MMEIMVCLKQVPDAAEVRVDPATRTLMRQGVAAMVNPFDLHALEEGVRCRERLGGGRVTAVSMGPPQAAEALREALARGADAAVLLGSRVFAGADTLATSRVLALAAGKLAPGLILAGKQAIDADTGQVGPELAAWLDWPLVCYVAKIREISPARAVVERRLDSGREVLEVDLPAVFTVIREINEPRLPSFKGRLRAKKAAIPVWDERELGADPAETGLAGSPTAVAEIFPPPRRERGEMPTAGTPAEAARLLAGKIRECRPA
ncbi:MAG: electron transfer flavoprotein subunit beta/FixA family protein [Planctomycetota bacterium]|jgi:electron transfer flavoprotein beta subunit|nr:electron transfer flavoprotein subunit beta/FixA family protein [Planctomycetota bacterium]